MKKLPILDCIKDSLFSSLLNDDSNKMIFKFNNSHLYEISQRDFSDIGMSNFDCLISDVNKKKNITSNITKQSLDFNFDKLSKNFFDSFSLKFNNQMYFNILKNIDSYDSNNEIPFDFIEIEKIFSYCSRKITKTPCKYCNNIKYTKYKEVKHTRNKISLFSLKRDNKLYMNCLYNYKIFTKEQLINSAIAYQIMKDYYNFRLIPISTLENDLNDLIDKRDENKKLYTDEITNQDNLYQNYLKGNFKLNYKDYLKNIIEVK